MCDEEGIADQYAQAGPSRLFPAQP
jgi:hypothetical protein